MEKKKFRLFDAVLAAVCIILVVEAAAPSAAIGNSQYFWWLLLLGLFFLPYGMISAELGTTYCDDEGGIYQWVQRAFGPRMGSRVAWYYWINFPLWMASLAVLFTTVIDQSFATTLGAIPALLIQLGFIWGVCFLSFFSISENKTLVNIGTIFKALLILAIGGLGVYWALTKGVANPITSVRDLLPGFDGIPFIAIILFNFMGFEVVTTFASEMDNPRKQIPKALFLGGILITFFYLFASFGIGAALPVDQLSTSGGLLDSFNLFFGNAQPVLLAIVGVMFLYTLVVNILTWAIGVDYVAKHAADHGAMPKVFASETKKGQPKGAAIMNGVVASALVIIIPVGKALFPSFEGFEDIFWAFFALNLITLLLSYVLMFPAFLKLRKTDKDMERPYRAPGGKVLTWLMGVVPVILLVLAIVFCITYPIEDGTWFVDVPLLVGTAVAVVIGEIIAMRTPKHSVGKERTIEK